MSRHTLQAFRRAAAAGVWGTGVRATSIAAAVTALLAIAGCRDGTAPPAVRVEIVPSVVAPDSALTFARLPVSLQRGIAASITVRTYGSSSCVRPAHTDVRYVPRSTGGGVTLGPTIVLEPYDSVTVGTVCLPAVVEYSRTLPLTPPDTGRVRLLAIGARQPDGFVPTASAMVRVAERAAARAVAR